MNKSVNFPVYKVSDKHYQLAKKYGFDLFLSKYAKHKKVQLDNICCYNTSRTDKKVTISILIPNKIVQNFLNEVAKIYAFRDTQSQFQDPSEPDLVGTHTKIIIPLDCSVENTFIIHEVIPAKLRLFLTSL